MYSCTVWCNWYTLGQCSNLDLINKIILGNQDLFANLKAVLSFPLLLKSVARQMLPNQLLISSVMNQKMLIPRDF